MLAHWPSLLPLSVTDLLEEKAEHDEVHSSCTLTL